MYLKSSWDKTEIMIGIETNIDVNVDLLTTWEIHHSPRAVVSIPVG